MYSKLFGRIAACIASFFGCISACIASFFGMYSGLFWDVYRVFWCFPFRFFDGLLKRLCCCGSIFHFFQFSFIFSFFFPWRLATSRIPAQGGFPQAELRPGGSRLAFLSLSLSLSSQTQGTTKAYTLPLTFSKS